MVNYMKVTVKQGQYEDRDYLVTENEQLKALVASQAQEMAALQRRLTKDWQEREALTRLLSDDFRNLTSSVLTFLQMLNANMLSVDDPACHTLSKAVERSAWGLQEALEHLADIYMIEAGQRAWEAAEFDVASLFRKVGADLLPIAAEREIVLEIDNPPDLIVRCDRWLIERVLKNLIENALNFVRPGKRVFVSATLAASGNEVILAVTDQGPGLGAAEQTLIFEMFYRETRQQVSGRRGMGLGLTFSRRAVEMMHGSLWVESELGQGSTFRVALPGAQG